MREFEDLDNDADYGDPACEKRGYLPVFHKVDQLQSYWNLRKGFYEASLLLVKGISEGRFNELFEGIAALFLFRHYLELSLKLISLEGRWLKTADRNAQIGEVKKIASIHSLTELWSMAIEDAKPKVSAEYWAELDIEFLDACISEFHEVDPNSFAFRYSGQETEQYLTSFVQLESNMSHAHAVCERIISWLAATYDQNAEWQSILNSY